VTLVQKAGNGGSRVVGHSPWRVKEVGGEEGGEEEEKEGEGVEGEEQWRKAVQ